MLYMVLIYSVLCLVLVRSVEEQTCEVQQGTCTTWGGEYLPEIPKIKYEGPDSKNPMAFHYYNADEVILGKPMKEWLRFSVAFWHTLRGDGSDLFGSPTKRWPWEDPNLSPLEMAFKRIHVLFEILDKLGVELWCFHDRDLAPEGETLAETNTNLDKVVEVAMELQKGSGMHPLWGTAQLFKHPRYMHGAATSPNATIFAFAAAQVKKALEVTQRLGGEHFVFWGGREGYHTLLNTNLKLELDNLGRFMRMATDFKHDIGFQGKFFIEPKPQEPTKHQYDWDAATAIEFLKTYNLTEDFQLNIECNHATLAGHTCEHELTLASVKSMLGNIDINTGDPQVGWDTDQFLTDPAQATLVMLAVVRQGGLIGGFNFDAKLRRESIQVEDIFYAHIGSMDALARGLRNVAKMQEDGIFDNLLAQRYASFGEGIGLDIVQQKVGFKELEKYALSQPDPVYNMVSGEQELTDIYFNMYLR